MKKLLLILFIAFHALSISAQSSIYGTDQKQNDYDQKVDSARRTYDAAVRKAWQEYLFFKKKANAEYAFNMRNAWLEFIAADVEEEPVFVDPEEAPDETNSFLSDVMEYAVDKVEKVIETVKQPNLFIPVPKPAVTAGNSSSKATDSNFHFSFYGTDCSVRLKESDRFKMLSTLEWSVSNTWKRLSGESYDNVINDCVWLRDSLKLNGWAYYTLLKSLSDSFLGADTDESTLFSIFLLMQSGYKVRVGRANGHLIMLIPSDCKIYSHVSTALSDGYKYYIFGPCRAGDKYSLYSNPFPNEKLISLRMDNLPLVADSKNKSRTFTSYFYPDVSVKISSNDNMMSFLNDYPVNDNWAFYSLTSLSKQTKDALYPTLRKKLKGKSEKEKANILIDFVQTAFKYKTDKEQFGYERPLFGDEIFYYPYSDCEDRSILFSILVRDLMNLDVVFIHYPHRHLSTAVKFKEGVYGSYVTYNNKKYTICDPTYIHARIGMVHRSFRDATLKIVPIK